MKFTKISRECIFPIDNGAHVCSRKTFYHISVNFRNPGFHSVSKPRKPVFIFKTGPTTNFWPGSTQINKTSDAVIYLPP